MIGNGITPEKFSTSRFGCDALNSENNQCDILRGRMYPQCTFNNCPFVYWINIYHETQRNIEKGEI